MPYLKSGGPHTRYWTIKERMIMARHMKLSSLVGKNHPLYDEQHKTVNQKIQWMVTLHGMSSIYNSKDDTISVKYPHFAGWYNASNWTINDLFLWLGYGIQ